MATLLRQGDTVRCDCGCFVHVVLFWDMPGGFSARVFPCVMHAETGDPAGSLVSCFPGGLYSRKLFSDLFKPVWDVHTGSKWL